MKNNIERLAYELLACVFLFCITGCMSQDGLQDGLKAKADADQDAKSMHTVLGTPIVPPSCDTVLIPVGIDSNFLQERMAYGISGGWSSSGFISSMGSGSYFVSGKFFDTGTIHWNNVVFYDKKTQQTHLLLDWRAVICEYLGPNSDAAGKPAKPPQYFLFAIADADTNKDGIINEKDALSLYVSDPSGHKITRVSPAGTHFEKVIFDDTNDHALYVQISIDSNHDGQFSPNDENVILLVDPLKPSEGMPMVGDQLKDQAFRIVAASKDLAGGNK
jgi:hypothetical protein